jgi:hypothetical protein
MTARKSKQLLNTVVTDPDQGATVKYDTALCNALCKADSEADVKTILTPFPIVEINDQQMWRFAGLTVEAILQFERDTNENRGGLQHLIFYCTSLLHVDVFSNVMNRALQKGEASSEPLGLETLETAGTDSTPTDAIDADKNVPTGEWYAVKRVLQQRKRKGPMQYLVEWENSNEKTWVHRRDISDFAMQAYLASRRRKRSKAQ